MPNSDPAAETMAPPDLSGYQPPRMLGNSDVRLHNLSVVMRTIHTRATCTRAELARATGLTKTAIGGLVNDLLDQGVLVEEEFSAHRVGRPSAPLRIARERFAAVVVDIGATYLCTTLSDLAGQVHTRETDLASSQSLRVSDRIELITSRIGAAAAAARDNHLRLVGVVVAAHGITDAHRGILRRHTTKDELDIAGQISEQLPGIPFVLVENDANLAALAEWERYRTDGVRHLISLSGELSIGAGIVLDGRLHEGRSGYAGSFSHITLDPAGPECTCGRSGCWRTLVGLHHVLRNALPEVATGLEQIPGYAPIAVDALIAAAQAENKQVLDALATAGHWLGEGTANIVNALDPDLVVVGGYYAAVAPWLMPAAHDALGNGALMPIDPAQLMVVSDLNSAPYRQGAADVERARVLGGGLHCVTERLIETPLALASL
ncbi:ROK family transcriptional regulator [Phytoactinopolyspora limicola]|uniref:ROK family transcriptional regulator n=1 Tax=Phytoactinopolyspora limicola TaxID=2715536 RepID=UPI00140AF96A|nr:ROK family transcriptional regulator [Phytoactinopolyspora limicola]